MNRTWLFAIFLASALLLTIGAQPASSEKHVGVTLETSEAPMQTETLEFAETIYEPHDPIFIDDNSDFEEFPGSGEEDDPWLITGYEFTAPGAILIHIQDTTDHFKILDCRFNGITQESDAIFLGNVRNGTIEDNYIINGFSGIYIGLSSDINITGNTAAHNFIGVSLSSSRGNIVVGNDFRDNVEFGILIAESWENEVNDNDVYQNAAGIVLAEGTRKNQIVENTVFGNQYEGIGLHFADHNNISDNHVFENGGGIAYEHSHFNNITWNEVHNNDAEGVGLNYEDTNSLIANNTIYENGVGIILTGNSNGNRIEDNTIHSHTWSGIFINNCGNNVVDNNTLFNNGIAGIALLESHDITLHNNTIFDCPYGIYLEYSRHNTVLNNTVTEATNAFQLQGSSHNTLLWNEAFRNVYSQSSDYVYSYGFNLSNSFNNTLSGNTVNFIFGVSSYVYIDVYSYGFYLEHSHSNTIAGNDVNIIDMGFGKVYHYIYSYGFYLEHSNNNTLPENTISVADAQGNVNNHVCSYGIFLDNSFNNTLSGNIIYVQGSLAVFNQVYSYGIYFYYSSNNTLSENTVSVFLGDGDDEFFGFYLEHSDYNTLLGNTVGVTDFPSQFYNYIYSYGFYLKNSFNNILSGNTVGGLFGVPSYVLNYIYSYGFYLEHSHNNTLSGNTDTIYFFDAGNAYGFYLSASENNTLSGNTVDLMVYIDSQQSASSSIFGFYLEECRFTLIQGNNFVSGCGVGITIHGGALNNITVNYLTNNEIAIWLDFSSQNTVTNNIIYDNGLGILADYNPNEQTYNGIYLNLFINNGQQIQQSGLNQWWHPEYELGNFWSNYWGEDLNDDYVGDTDLPHEGIDYFPLLDPSIPEAFGPLPYTDWWLMWRGGWSPVEIQVIDPLGRAINSTVNEIGLTAFYIEDTEWDPDHTMVMILIGIDPATAHFSSYTFMMIALENLDYSMEWLVSGRGEVLFERTIENAPLAAGQTRVIETNLELNPDGSLTVTPVAQYTFGGILRPIMEDGTSVFQQGGTIPVKFQLFSDDGLSDDNAHATLEIAQVVDGEVGDFVSANSTGKSNEGNVFRYDPEKEQYVFNLDTMELAPGTYRLRITLDDGQLFEVDITIV